MSDFYRSMYNPDVLTCLANLSNDEVFTPPEVANRMLDMLPEELWHDSSATFLDPACKSGVFLREIAKRLIEGLKEEIPDLQERIDHIFHKQLYGIAITELTSLLSRRSVYCSKYPNSKYSITLFEDTSGNIRYKRIPHRWQNGKCLFCGASESEYERGDELETHAYEWIHTIKPEEIFKMKFDVIIGNPPYQLNTGTTTAQATPLYDKFVLQAIKLNPRYLSMIIPARWFAGGMGLDKFRESMLNDDRIRRIVDYPNAKDCFEGISIGGGVCYFLWDRDHKGSCRITNVNNGKENTLDRDLSEFPVFVRYNEAVSIIQKVSNNMNTSISEIVSSLSPFGIGSAERGNEKQTKNSDLRLLSSRGYGFYDRAKVTQGKDYIGKWKVALSKVTSEHAGEPNKDGQFKVLSKVVLLEPSDICTFSYFLVGHENSEQSAKNILSYLTTKFVRFLLLQAVSSINISKDKFRFIPMQDFSKAWTDAELYEKYGLTDEEIAFIESMIKPMKLGGDDNGN